MSEILICSEYGPLMQAKMADLNWKDETRVRLGVGSVKSFTDYMDRMTGQYGYEVSFLQEIDLADAVLINENRLLFTVCDAYGSPVGFASRNLGFEAESREWQTRGDRILADGSLTDGGRKDALAANNEARLPKYKNTSGRSKNVWYTKINLLFGFHLARRAGAPLWVMEGYPDAVTAHDVGMTNVCAIGATAFTKEHVDVLIATGTKHIVVVLDGDSEGYKATDRAVKVIEEAVGERVGFRVELIQMPEGSDDPDRFIRLYGRADFEALPRMDIFSWKIRRQMQTGSDPIQLCTEAIPLIVNEASHLLRLKAARSLALATGVPEETILAEIGRIVDQDRAKAAEEKGLILARMQSDLKRSPASANENMRQAMAQIEQIEGAKEGHSPKNVQVGYEYVFEKQAAHVSDIEIATGFPIWDKKLGGLPRGAAFLSVPGKPNHGKTSTCSNLAWRVPDLNPDVVTLFHTVEDSLEKAIPRILGSKYGLPSKLWRKYGYYSRSHEGQDEVAEKWPEFPKVYRESKEWLAHNLENERLIVADINLLAGSLPALEGWLRTIRSGSPMIRSSVRATTSRSTSWTFLVITKPRGPRPNPSSSSAWPTSIRPVCS